MPPKKATKGSTVVETPPMPSVSQIETEFEKLLDSFGPTFPAEKKNTMRAFANDQKWILICQNDQRAKTVKSVSAKATVKSLKEKMDPLNPEVVGHLVVSLSGEPQSWADEFISLSGVDILTDIITEGLIAKT